MGSIIYSEKKAEYEAMGYMPFVCIVKWTPEGRPAVSKRFWEFFSQGEGKGVKGVHVWKLIGRDMMVLIGWTISVVSLQKFCTLMSLGIDISMDVCPAIDSDGLAKALKELKPDLTKISSPKARARVSRAPKA